MVFVSSLLHLQLLQYSPSLLTTSTVRSTTMDRFKLFNITHPNIQEPSKHSLYHSQAFRHTLTNNEFLDNVLVAVSFFLLLLLLKDIITTIVYMRPRFCAASDTVTYFSQARIVLFDNSYLLRWVRKFQLFDGGHYN